MTARFLVRNIKYALLIIFVVAAVITPSGDMMTQAIFAAPMIGLYALSIVIAWVVAPKRESSDVTSAAIPSTILRLTRSNACTY